MDLYLPPNKLRIFSRNLFVTTSALCITSVVFAFIANVAMINKFANIIYYIFLSWIFSFFCFIVLSLTTSKIGYKIGNLLKIGSSRTKIAGFIIFIAGLFLSIIALLFMLFNFGKKPDDTQLVFFRIATYSALIIIPLSLVIIGNKIIKIIFYPILLLTLVLATFVFTFPPHKIIGNSMFPTLKNGQYVLSSKIIYLTNNPTRGDIVVFKNATGNDFVGRIIALPNENIAIKNGHVYINNELLQENYLSKDIVTDTGKFINADGYYVPVNSYIVMGDNRTSSNDSRAFGAIAKSQIRDKAIFIYWPKEDVGFLKRTSPTVTTPESRFINNLTDTQTATSEDKNLTCKTIGTKMVIQQNGYGEIGCDIETNGKIDLIRSYCIGENSRQTDILRPDAYGKENGYYVTLHNLFPNEKVRVFAFDLEGNKIECLPALN